MFKEEMRVGEGLQIPSTQEIFLVQNLIGGADDAGCERATEVEPQRISNCRSSSTLFEDPPWSRPRLYILGIGRRFALAHASHKYWGAGTHGPTTE